MRRDLLVGYAAAMFTVVCWSFNFPLLRYALVAYHPWDFWALRLGVAAAVVAPFQLGVLFHSPRPRPSREGLALLGVGLVGVGLSTFFLAAGLATVTAGSGAFVVVTVPIFSALLARGFFGEQVGRLGWLGIGISMGGVLLIVFGEAHVGTVSAGAAWVLGSAVCQALFYVFQKSFHQRFTPFQITSVAVLGSGLAALALTPGLAERVAAAPLGATLAAGYMGAVSLVVAFITWSFALSRLKAARVTSTMYALPLLSFLEAWLWLGELPSPTAVLGGIIALGGVMVLGWWGK